MSKSSTNYSSEATSTTTATPAPATVKVKLLADREFDGRRLVYRTDTLDAYLVPASEVKRSYAEQEISEDVINAAIQPYSWDAEINNMAASRKQITLALLASGLVEKQDIDVRELVALALIRGTLPVIGG